MLRLCGYCRNIAPHAWRQPTLAGIGGIRWLLHQLIDCQGQHAKKTDGKLHWHACRDISPQDGVQQLDAGKPAVTDLLSLRMWLPCKASLQVRVAARADGDDRLASSDVGAQSDLRAITSRIHELAEVSDAGGTHDTWNQPQRQRSTGSCISQSIIETVIGRFHNTFAMKPTQRRRGRRADPRSPRMAIAHMLLYRRHVKDRNEPAVSFAQWANLLDQKETAIPARNSFRCFAMG